jgi:hypothetical protein
MQVDAQQSILVDGICLRERCISLNRLANLHTYINSSEPTQISIMYPRAFIQELSPAEKSQLQKLGIQILLLDHRDFDTAMHDAIRKNDSFYLSDSDTLRHLLSLNKVDPSGWSGCIPLPHDSKREAWVKEHEIPMSSLRLRSKL